MTYIFHRRENGRDGCVLQVADAPSDVKAVLCEVLAAQVLMSTWGPLLPLHVVHPFLKPWLVLQGKPRKVQSVSVQLSIIMICIMH